MWGPYLFLTVDYNNDLKESNWYTLWVKKDTHLANIHYTQHFDKDTVPYGINRF